MSEVQGPVDVVTHAPEDFAAHLREVHDHSVNRIRLQVYKLGLPARMRLIQDTFYVSLLDPVKGTTLDPHGPPQAPPALYMKDDHKYFEIENFALETQMSSSLLFHLQELPES